MDTLFQIHVSSLRVRTQFLLKESDRIHNGLRLHYTLHTKKFSTRRRNGPTRYRTSFRLSTYSVRARSRSTTHEGYTSLTARSHEPADSWPTARCRYLRPFAARPALNRPELSLRNATTKHFFLNCFHTVAIVKLNALLK